MEQKKRVNNTLIQKEVDKLFLNYKKLMIPSVIIIAVSLLTGFGVQEKQDVVTGLLTDRAFILQKAYYGEISVEEAEAQLCKVETQPILKEDVTLLKSTDFTDMDMVQRLEVSNLYPKMNMFDNVSFQGYLTWYMRGLSGDYITEGNYFILLKENAGQWKLSQFTPIEN